MDIRSASWILDFWPKASARRLLILLFFVNAAVMMPVGISVYRNYVEVRDVAVANTSTLSQAVSQTVSGTIDKLDVGLMVLADEVARQQSSGGIDPASLDRFIARMDSHVPEALGFRFFGPDGIMVAGHSNVTAAPIQSADRPYFITLRDDPHAGLVISSPLRGRASGVMQIQFSRRVSRQDGSFAGIVTAPVPVATLSRLAGSGNLGTGGAAAVYLENHTMITRYPLNEAADTTIGTPTVTPRLAEIIDSGQSGIDDYVSPVDHIARTGYVRRIGSYPLYLIVSVSRAEYLLHWQRNSIILVLLTTVIALTSSVAAVVIRRKNQDRAQIHQQLLASEMRYRGVVETQWDFVVRMDKFGRFIFVNHAFASALERQVDDLLAQDWRTVIVAQDVPIIAAAIGTAIRDTGKPSLVEGRLIAPSGPIWVAWEGYAISGNDGIFSEIQAVGRDITAQKTAEMERRIAEVELRATAARLNLVLSTTAEGIIGLDERRRIMFANPAASAILGWSAPAMMHGKASHEMTGHRVADGSSCSEATCHIRAAITSGETIRVTDEYFTKRDGTVLPVEYVVSPLTVADTPMGAVVAFHDIADRKAMEDRLKSANMELEQFAYVASHDLRQPLRQISSYLSLIEHRLTPGQLSDDLKSYFAFAVSGAKRMDRLIVDLLDYSRTGRTIEPFSHQDLSQVIEESLSNLSISITEADAEIRVDADLPTINGVHGDLVRLFQNLIGNAIKYHKPDAPPHIDIGWHCDDRLVTVWVSDNGIGIEPENRDRAFQLFQRLVPKDAYEGTGIGLAICKRIVEHHGGHIWIDTAPDGGTQFTFTFPKPVILPIVQNSDHAIHAPA